MRTKRITTERKMGYSAKKGHSPVLGHEARASKNSMALVGHREEGQFILDVRQRGCHRDVVVVEQERKGIL